MSPVRFSGVSPPPPARPLHGLTSVIFLIIFSLVTGAQTALLALSPDRLADNGKRRELGAQGSCALLSVLVARAEAGLLQEASKDDRLHFLSGLHATLSVVLSRPFSHSFATVQNVDGGKPDVQ